MSPVEFGIFFPRWYSFQKTAWSPSLSFICWNKFPTNQGMFPRWAAAPAAAIAASPFLPWALFCSTFLHVAPLLHLLFLEFQGWRVLIPCRNPANSIPAGWRCSLYLHTSPVGNSLHQVDFLIWTQLCSINPLLMTQPSEVPEQSVYFSFLDILQMCADSSLVFLALHPHLLLPGKFHEFSQFIPNIIADLSENQIYSLLCTYQCGKWKC